MAIRLLIVEPCDTSSENCYVDDGGALGYGGYVSVGEWGGTRCSSQHFLCLCGNHDGGSLLVAI